MIALRRGVGSDSRKLQIPPRGSAVRSGRLVPSRALTTVESAVYSAAATMIQSQVGEATIPILIGAMMLVIQIAIALMMTTKKPRLENRSRPVSATITGRANRLTSTRIV